MQTFKSFSNFPNVKMSEPQISGPETWASFLIPVIEGKIYLGQRATEPQKGLYGAIGGHLEPASVVQGEPHRIEKPGGSMQPSVIERIAKARGLEYLRSAGVRECLEELFHGEEPDMACASDIVEVRGVDDYPKGKKYFNYFFLGTINRPVSEIRPAPEELTDVRPLTDVPVDQIYPIAQAALEETRMILTHKLAPHEERLQSYLRMNIAAQIPRFDLEEMRRFLSERGFSFLNLGLLVSLGHFSPYGFKLYTEPEAKL
jgi:hypothetical protein